MIIRKIGRQLLVTVLLLGLLVVPQLKANRATQTPVYAAAGAGHGNSGDIKISPAPVPAHGNQGNDPHVPCQFYVLGFNFAASQGTLTVASWPPTGDGTTVLADTYTGTPDDTGTYQMVNGPYSLPAGHYKVYVTDNKGASIAKQKVFWVEACPATPTPQATDTPVPPTDTPCGGISTTCGAGVVFTVSRQMSHMLLATAGMPRRGRFALNGDGRPHALVRAVRTRHR